MMTCSKHINREKPWLLTCTNQKKSRTLSFLSKKMLLCRDVREFLHQFDNKEEQQSPILSSKKSAYVSTKKVCMFDRAETCKNSCINSTTEKTNEALFFLSKRGLILYKTALYVWSSRDVQEFLYLFDDRKKQTSPILFQQKILNSGPKNPTCPIEQRRARILILIRQQKDLSMEPILPQQKKPDSVQKSPICQYKRALYASVGSSRHVQEISIQFDDREE